MLINFKLFISNKVEKKLINLIEFYKEKLIPTMPIEVQYSYDKV